MDACIEIKSKITVSVAVSIESTEFCPIYYSVLSNSDYCSFSCTSYILSDQESSIFGYFYCAAVQESTVNRLVSCSAFKNLL